MPLSVLANEYKIKKAQKIFEEKMKKYITKQISVRIGHLGHSWRARVKWCERLGIWFTSSKIKNRFWNGFGIGRPKVGENVPIVCEINFPLKGIHRNIAGAFVEDDSGNVFVAHRGRIGGGRRGIGKSLFEDRYRGKWAIVKDGKVESSIALIGALNSPNFARQVSTFVHDVGRIKHELPSARPVIIDSWKQHIFRKEFVGTEVYQQRENIEAECDHGVIVNDLAEALQKYGYRVGNDMNRDLYVVDRKGRIKTVFEVKADISTSSIYEAIGTLLFNNIHLPYYPRLILVFPYGLPKTYARKLEKLGIEVLAFKWKDDKVFFPKLRSLDL